MRKFRGNWMFIFILVFIFGISFASAVTSFASSIAQQPRASFQTVYGEENRLITYWPILGENQEDCKARQDIILQVAPAGCEPMVVRSDLLAEQNVPVFCQIDAMEINPLINIEQIRAIRFSNSYPKDIVGAGFHPARAALRSNDKLLGSPLINNIGYIVVVLKRNEVEKSLPDFVNVTLSASIDYDSGNAYGIGKAEFALEPVTDEQWDELGARYKNSFWNGRYALRLERAEPDYAVVSIYDGMRKVATAKVNAGKESETIWVPGAYCRAGVKVAYDGYIGDKDRALIEVGDSNGNDRVTVFVGSKFLNDKCTVEKIEIDDGSITGSLTARCSSGERVVLGIGNMSEYDSNMNEIINNFELPGWEGGKLYLSEDYDATKVIKVYFDSDKKKDSNIVFDKGKVKFNEAEVGSVSDNTIKLELEKFILAAKELWGESQFKNYLYEKINGASIGKNIINLMTTEKSNELSKFVIKKQADAELDKELNDSIAAYERVVDEYPIETRDGLSMEEKWGELALRKAIDLAEGAKDMKTMARLKKKFIDTYPDSKFTPSYTYELNRMEGINLADAIGGVKIDNKFWNIQLISLQKQKEKSSATFALTGVNSPIKIDEKDVKDEIGGKDGKEGYVKSIRLEKIVDKNNVQISVGCWAKDVKGFKEVSGGSLTLGIGEDSRKACDKSNIKLSDITMLEIAKVRLLPDARGTSTQTNLSVRIGIEKRAIKLSPNKTADLIKTMNKSIEQWQNIADKLGKVVTGLKTACFATAGVLTVKNFFSGLSGEALARNKVMQGDNGWNQRCAGMVSKGKYSTLSECYLENSDEINADVSKTEEIIGKVDSNIKSVEDGLPKQGGGLLEGESIDRSVAAVDYCEGLKARYLNNKITMKDGNSKSVTELLGNCKANYNNGMYGYEDLREMEFNLMMKQDSSASETLKSNSDSLLESSALRIADNTDRYNTLLKEDEARKRGEPASIYIESSGGRANMVGEVVAKDSIKDINFKDLGGDITSTHFSRINVGSASVKDGTNTVQFKGGTYYLGSIKGEDRGYDVQEVFEKQTDGSYNEIANSGQFFSAYNIGRITSTESVSYNNAYENPKIKYYETQPYKGLPALVPFDRREGWYAATKQTLPSMGGIKSYDESGRVMSFFLCNVGKNKREQFFEGYGDDICQQINMNTGQPLGSFPGLSETEAKRRVSQAITALNDAANNYGKKGKSMQINGQTFEIGDPAVSVPTMQCQNLMSPKECNILFNVCDPVICPPSRCDFGGKYPVADVIQTGIIGSTLLCLPNVKEKILIPVCLTGIHAGIEGFISIMKSYRDCLQESLDSGKIVGICDQLYSIYLCEFFWRQIAPLAKVIIPKIIESAYGEGTRGGGEYLSVMAAWDNMQNSVNYFTQEYAVNSMKAFKARSIEEVGSEFCKAYISVKTPTSFDGLVEPDSPPQFNAWFSSTAFTSATVPATSQYKVFYHIFAGNDQGVYFNVYLKNPPENSYYSIPATIQVASGFVGKGQYATESKDFTAPEGYKELCVRVNDQEECGFKEVSTSFALNYASDAYAKSEIDENAIIGEKNCISGSSAGVKEAIVGTNYERGVVRICSTNNPGSQTDPLRFVEVGICDDQKIKCWLDKESVKNAITDNNVGLRDATLAELEATQNAKLAEQGIIVGNDQAGAEIFAIKTDIGNAGIGTKITDKFAKKSKVDELVTRLGLLYEKVILNYRKAEILYMIGNLKAMLVEGVVTATKAGAASATGATAGTPTTIYHYGLGVEEQISGTTTSGRFIYLGNIKSKIFYTTNVIWIYLPNKSPNIQEVGNINNNKITMINEKITSLQLTSDYTLILNDLNEKTIGDLNAGKIVVSNSAVESIRPATDSIPSSVTEAITEEATIETDCTIDFYKEDGDEVIDTISFTDNLELRVKDCMGVSGYIQLEFIESSEAKPIILNTQPLLTNIMKNEEKIVLIDKKYISENSIYRARLLLKNAEGYFSVEKKNVKITMKSEGTDGAFIEGSSKWNIIIKKV